VPLTLVAAANEQRRSNDFFNEYASRGRRPNDGWNDSDVTMESDLRATINRETADPAQGKVKATEVKGTDCGEKVHESVRYRRFSSIVVPPSSEI